MSKSVVIIGGGIAGLSLAYFLNKAQVQVTLIDASNLDDSSSCGNAGFLSMFDKSPFAYPGVFRDTIAAILKGKSPMSVGNVFDMALWRWGYHFYRASSQRKLIKTSAILEHFGEEVFEFYDTLLEQDGIECEYRRDGFALLFSDPAKYKKKLKSIEPACSHHHVMQMHEIERDFPLLNPASISGAIVLKRNGQVNPERVVQGLYQLLQKRGVIFKLQQRVCGFEFSGNKVKSAKLEKSAAIEADEFVVATGANVELLKALGADLVMTPGRGYSITFALDAALKPRLPALFVDVYTAITPRKHDTRITGRIEFGSGAANSEAKARQIVAGLRRYTKDFNIENAKLWSGQRPLTADDMPYVGRDRRYSNCSYLTGMGHTGMNIGPVSARILSQLLIESLPNHASPELLLLSGFFQG